MSFDFGLFTPYVNDPEITDIDSNSKVVYVTNSLTGSKKVLDLEPHYLEEMINRISNYKAIDKEFNYHSPILSGTMDGLRIHAVHGSTMKSGCWLSIRKNPIDLVVERKHYKKIFGLLDVANALKWSYVFGGERGSGKTQFMRTCLSLLDKNTSMSIIAESDEMHMVQLLPERLIAPYIINDVVDYTTASESVLRDNSDYIVYQEIRDGDAVDALMKGLSSSSRVLATMHVKESLLLPQRMVQLSERKNDTHMISEIHDYIQMCIMPVAQVLDGKIIRYIGEIALFWNDENHQPQKQLIYENNGKKETFYELPLYYQNMMEKSGLTLNWK